MDPSNKVISGYLFLGRVDGRNGAKVDTESSVHRPTATISIVKANDAASNC